MSVILCLTCLGLLVCIPPTIGDLRLQLSLDNSNICLHSRELQISVVKVTCAAGSVKHFKGFGNGMKYVEFA